MFQISKQVDYATQLLRALPSKSDETYLSLRKFSTDSNISFLFLQRIARELKAAGIIDATRGASGGYYVLADKDAFTLKQLIEILEGPVGITACTRGKECSHEDTCKAKSVFKKANKTVVDVLESTLVMS